MAKHKRHLEFEINLIPYIDLLSVCICFLLLTAVWMSVGALNVKQSVGGQPAAETERKPTLWVEMGVNGDVLLTARDSAVPVKLARTKIDGAGGHIDREAVRQAANGLRAADASLATALIQPNAKSVYEDIVGLMDAFRKEGLVDLGVSPL